MIVMLTAAALYAAAFQTASVADNARLALRTCIKQAAAEAKGQKVTNDAFTGFVRTKCAAQTTSFKAAVWAFDAKNKVSKRQSESDSDFQVEDFVTSAADRYAAENAPN